MHSGCTQELQIWQPNMIVQVILFFMGCCHGTFRGCNSSLQSHCSNPSGFQEVAFFMIFSNFLKLNLKKITDLEILNLKDGVLSGYIQGIL